MPSVFEQRVHCLHFLTLQQLHLLKRLYLIRHAKSAWNSPDLPDHDRPLNDRGNSDAAEMAKKLAERSLPDAHFLVSSAKRTQQTMQHICVAIPDGTHLISTHDHLYLASPQVILQYLNGLPEACQTAIVIGHNPGISELAGYLGGDVVSMVTAQVVGLELEAEQWSHLGAGTGSIVYFDYPKQHHTS